MMTLSDLCQGVTLKNHIASLALRQARTVSAQSSDSEDREDMLTEIFSKLDIKDQQESCTTNQNSINVGCQRFQEDFVDILPEAWTVCSLTVSADHKSLMLARWSAKCTPVLVRIPLTKKDLAKCLYRYRPSSKENKTTNRRLFQEPSRNKKNSHVNMHPQLALDSSSGRVNARSKKVVERVDEDRNSDGDDDDENIDSAGVDRMGKPGKHCNTDNILVYLQEELLSILSDDMDSNVFAQSAKHDKSKWAGWWETKEQLDQRMDAVIRNIEDHFLGCWKVLLLGSLLDYTTEKKLSAKLPALTAMLENVSQQRLFKHGTNSENAIDQSLLALCFAGLPWLSSNNYEQLKEFIAELMGVEDVADSDTQLALEEIVKQLESEYFDALRIANMAEAFNNKVMKHASLCIT
jgi:hypothetical protein